MGADALHLVERYRLRAATSSTPLPHHQPVPPLSRPSRGWSCWRGRAPPTAPIAAAAPAPTRRYLLSTATRPATGRRQLWRRARCLAGAAACPGSRWWAAARLAPTLGANSRLGVQYSRLPLQTTSACKNCMFILFSRHQHAQLWRRQQHAARAAAGSSSSVCGAGAPAAAAAVVGRGGRSDLNKAALQRQWCVCRGRDFNRKAACWLVGQQEKAGRCRLALRTGLAWWLGHSGHQRDRVGQHRDRSSQHGDRPGQRQNRF